MTGDAAAPGTRRTRSGGRSARVVETVLAAALAEFAQGGYAGLRVEEVAARAGVNKTTVYRRWPTKAALLAEVLRAIAPRVPTQPPDTGSVTGDLLALAKQLVDDARRVDVLVVGRLLTAELDWPEVRAVTATLREELLAAWRAAIERGVARGELPPGTSAELVTHTIGAALMSRLFRGHAHVDEAFVAAIVELVICGAKHGGATPRKPTRTRRAARSE